MKYTVTSLAAASLLTLATAAHAQTSGVSHPEALNDEIKTTATPSSDDHYHKPSPLIPAASAQPVTVAATTATETHPVHSSSVPAPAVRSDDPEDHVPAVNPDDPTSGVVMSVAAPANSLPEGTSFKAALDDTISTSASARGNHFSARLTADVMRNGKVYLPVGSVLHGRITGVRVGKTFGAGAMLHLVPDTITLPDGVPYPVDAQVVDVDPQSVIAQNSHVNEEGEIIADKHAKAKVAAVSLAAGSGAAAGALLGAGVGAIVGAGIGAGAGVVVLAKQDQQQVLPADTVLVFNLNRALIVNGR
ncbi:MAG: hypothetical protein PW735_00430 [Acidobacteriaceae bacterium]|nr:hypothetical protein [Acidobacteriaceae bacterium]